MDIESFYRLRGEADFEHYDKKALENGLRNSLVHIVVYKNDKAIGIGRVVGDGCIAFLLKDIIVDISERGKGIGKLIMNELLNKIYTIAENHAYIYLMSTPDNEQFYNKFGFVTRPNETLGSGMLYIYDKNKQ